MYKLFLSVKELFAIYIYIVGDHVSIDYIHYVPSEQVLSYVFITSQVAINKLYGSVKQIVEW